MQDIIWMIWAEVLALVASAAFAWSWFLRRKVAASNRLLAETTGWLRAAQRLAGVGAWDWNPASGEFAISHEAAAILDFPGESHLNFAGFLARVHAYDRAAVERAFRACADNGEPLETFWRQTDATGSIRHLAALGECGAAGKTRVCRGAFSDVTDRVRAEAAMRQNFTLLDAFVADAPALIHFKDVDGRIKLVNKAYTEFTGRLKEDVIGNLSS